MVIGFTERKRTVSEGHVPGVEEFPLEIDVATLRVSEREHWPMLYRVLSNSTARVVSFLSLGIIWNLMLILVLSKQIP